MLGGRVVRSLETYVCKGSLPREWCGYVVLETIKQEYSNINYFTYITLLKILLLIFIFIKYSIKARNIYIQAISWKFNKFRGKLY